MNYDEQARTAITSLEERQQELQRRFDDEQRKLQERLARNQERLAEKQRSIVQRMEQEQQRLHSRFGMETGAESTGRDRILDQATELFITRGYLDVSMREIAEAAGLRKATIYHHFKDKDELFIAVAMRAMSIRRSEMQAVVDRSLPLPELLETMAAMQLNQWDPGMMRIAQDMQEHIPESKHDELHKELFEMMQVYTGVFERALERAEIVGIDPVLASAAFFHMVSAWMWDPFGHLKDHLQEPAEMARLAVSMLLYGLAGPALRDVRKQ